jgi:hypothetical protein
MNIVEILCFVVGYLFGLEESLSALKEIVLTVIASDVVAYMTKCLLAAIREFGPKLISRAIFTVVWKLLSSLFRRMREKFPTLRPIHLAKIRAKRKVGNLATSRREKGKPSKDSKSIRNRLPKG